jgi:hypothetical protein
MNPIVDKIAKLLALAEGKGTTPAEASTAAAQAQRLMDRHKLTRAAVEDHERPEGIERDTEPLYVGRRMVSWLRVLASGVTRTNDCRLLMVKRSDGQRRLELLGRASSVAVARHLFAYLQREIDRLSKEALRERHFPGRGGARTWGNNFRLAAAVEVSERLKRERLAVRLAAQSQGATTALVRLDQHGVELDRVLKKMVDGTAAPVRAGTCDEEARAAGRRAGRGIALRQAVGEGAAVPKLEESA